MDARKKRHFLTWTSQVKNLGDLYRLNVADTDQSYYYMVAWIYEYGLFILVPI